MKPLGIHIYVDIVNFLGATKWENVKIFPCTIWSVVCLETRSLTAYSSGDFKNVICYPTLCTFTIGCILVAMCSTIFSFMLLRIHVFGLQYSLLMFGICFEAANAPVSEFTLLGCFLSHH